MFGMHSWISHQVKALKHLCSDTSLSVCDARIAIVEVFTPLFSSVIKDVHAKPVSNTYDQIQNSIVQGIHRLTLLQNLMN